MDIGLFTIMGLVIGILVGFFVGKFITDKLATTKIENAENEAKRLIEAAEKEGQVAIKDKQLEAEKAAQKIVSAAEHKTKQQYKKLDTDKREHWKKENQLKQDLNALKQKTESLERRERDLKTNHVALEEELEQTRQKKQELSETRQNLKKRIREVEKQKEKLNQEYQRELEKVANLTVQEAKEQLIQSTVEEAKSEAMAHVKDIMDEAKLKANREAKKIIIQTIQRTAAEHTIENTVSVFNLESDDIKGQIIGREGRNIRALEAATGIEIIVDDTPEAIVISGYDPVRREVARLSLQRLVTDGRIHPARIEEVVAKTRKQLDQQINEIGERTIIDLNIHGMHPQLIKTVGRMRFRSSYGQNLLEHSIETARLCAVMAAELGLGSSTIKLAKRAGLLHDIGKVPQEESELSHALLGMEWTKKYKEHPAVCNAVGAHHDEIEMQYIISPIIQACDAISGARPGARREILESYLKRIKDLENLAMDFDGVEKAYAIQAGRELRVIVESEKVPDEVAEDISFKISKKIQDEMQYPGQIKVTVIRETRAVTFAR